MVSCRTPRGTLCVFEIQERAFLCARGLREPVVFMPLAEYGPQPSRLDEIDQSVMVCWDLSDFRCVIPPHRVPFSVFLVHGQWSSPFSGETSILHVAGRYHNGIQRGENEITECSILREGLIPMGPRGFFPSLSFPLYSLYIYKSRSLSGTRRGRGAENDQG